MANTQSRKNEKVIPISVIKRLPIYYRCLVNLLNRDMERISSRELAEKIGVTASQIRQDLSHFGNFGQRGYGYNINDLSNAIANILGINHNFTMVLIGAGNLGTAIANYPNFKQRGFQIKAVFDNDISKIGMKLSDCTIQHINKLEDFLQVNNIDIGILTIPAEETQYFCNIFKEYGIKGIWNFAPVSLNTGNQVMVENVHISESLMTLAYRLKEEC
ncbi:MAG: redox-sensing transcriptional repressor Rex [Halanaerobiaceae bacterium]